MLCVRMYNVIMLCVRMYMYMHMGENIKGCIIMNQCHTRTSTAPVNSSKPINAHTF